MTRNNLRIFGSYKILHQSFPTKVVDLLHIPWHLVVDYDWLASFLF